MSAYNELFKSENVGKIFTRMRLDQSIFFHVKQDESVKLSHAVSREQIIVADNRKKNLHFYS